MTPKGHSQSRAPAVEPQRQIINQNSSEYKQNQGFQFKNGQPISTTDSQPAGIGLYAVIFMLALASMPFLMHVIFRGDVLPGPRQHEEGFSDLTKGHTPLESPITSLQDFRENKASEDGPNKEEKVKKAG